MADKKRLSNSSEIRTKTKEYSEMFTDTSCHTILWNLKYLAEQSLIRLIKSMTKSDECKLKVVEEQLVKDGFGYDKVNRKKIYYGTSKKSLICNPTHIFDKKTKKLKKHLKEMDFTELSAIVQCCFASYFEDKVFVKTFKIHYCWTIFQRIREIRIYLAHHSIIDKPIFEKHLKCFREFFKILNVSKDEINRHLLLNSYILPYNEISAKSFLGVPDNDHQQRLANFIKCDLDLLIRRSESQNSNKETKTFISYINSQNFQETANLFVRQLLDKVTTVDSAQQLLNAVLKLCDSVYDNSVIAGYAIKILNAVFNDSSKVRIHYDDKNQREFKYQRETLILKIRRNLRTQYVPEAKKYLDTFINSFKITDHTKHGFEITFLLEQLLKCQLDKEDEKYVYEKYVRFFKLAFTTSPRKGFTLRMKPYLLRHGPGHLSRWFFHQAVTNDSSMTQYHKEYLLKWTFGIRVLHFMPSKSVSPKDQTTITPSRKRSQDIIDKPNKKKCSSSLDQGPSTSGYC